MGSTFWYADSLATQLNADANAARAANVLKTQQGYHSADAAIMRAGLAELQRLDPNNPLMISAVRSRIFDQAEREFWRHGWDRGSSFKADPNAILAQLQAEFDEARVLAIKNIEAQPIRPRRRGWIFYNRRTVFAWRGTDHDTEAQAAAAQHLELARLRAAQLGDQLSVP